MSVFTGSPVCAADEVRGPVYQPLYRSSSSRGCQTVYGRPLASPVPMSPDRRRLRGPSASPRASRRPCSGGAVGRGLAGVSSRENGRRDVEDGRDGTEGSEAFGVPGAAGEAGDLELLREPARLAQPGKGGEQAAGSPVPGGPEDEHTPYHGRRLRPISRARLKPLEITPM